MTPGRADAAIGVAGAALGAAGAAAASGDAGTICGTAALGATLALARWWPATTSAVAAATFVLAVLAMDPTSNQDVPALALLGAHAFCAGRFGGRGPAVAGLAVVVVAAVTGALVIGEGGFVPYLFVVLTGWGTGRALRERTLVAGQLAERARELEEERDAYADLSVRYERARIASELHDIVAHAISVMVVQASAGQRLAARDPQLTEQTFAAIAGAARQAEQDMGRLVALLGDPDAIGPAPDLGLVEELVTRASGSGLDVTLRLEGEREGLPADVVALAFRVVQEGLTNALRYAAGSAVTVLIRAERDGLLVSVGNGAARGAAVEGVGSGHGLAGLRERVAAKGGTFVAGPRGAGWLLEAQLPRRAGSPAGVTTGG